MKESLIDLNYNYPKHSELKWEIQVGKGKWEECGKPFYRTDFNKKTRDIVNINKEGNVQKIQTTIFDFI
jgi:hypothetical protein